jgi:hypothetical protein
MRSGASTASAPQPTTSGNRSAGLDACGLARVKKLESENSRLKWMVAELALENEAIKAVLKKLQRRPSAGVAH